MSFFVLYDVEEPPALVAGDDQQTFRGLIEGHYSGQPRQYGLWLFTENPNGQFADSNPNLTCSDRM